MFLVVSIVKILYVVNVVCLVFIGKDSKEEGINDCGGRFGKGGEIKKVIVKKRMFELDFVVWIKNF